MALKFPLKCFFLFFKEKNIPKLENKGNSLPPNHTKLTLGAWRESMETRKLAVNPAEWWGGSWAAPSPGPLLQGQPGAEVGWSWCWKLWPSEHGLPPSTHGPTLGGRRGGVHALQGGPRGSGGWAKWENLPGSCPHHATLWSQAEPTHRL